MVSVEFKESLLNVYYGEQFGEAFYATLLAETDDDNEKLILTARYGIVRKTMLFN